MERLGIDCCAAGERGASAVMVALLLAVLGGMLAMGLNLGHLMAARSQLQNACDAAALAGAQELDGTAEGLSRARSYAADFAARHATDRGLAVEIDPLSDVVFGHWDLKAPKASAFAVLAPSAPGALKDINAVLVRAGREERRGSPLEVYFPAFSGGKQKANVRAEAVAANGAPCQAACVVPLALAECVVKTSGDELLCDPKLIFQNDSSDNVGFTNLRPGVGSVNTSDIRDALNGPCRTVTVGDALGMSNGNNLNKNVVDAFEGFMARQNSRQVTVPVMSVPGGCPPKYNGMGTVIGFATLTVGPDVKGPPHPAIPISMTCGKKLPDPSPVGCGYFGTTGYKPGLVR